jgi:septal ring factor EnvC (AmiA/AmiB activator)
MEDSLKKWTDQHRDEFEAFKAPDALWSKISADLQARPQAKVVAMRPRAHLRPLVRVAAAVALLLVASALWLGYGAGPDPSDDLLLSQYPALQQAEQQYGGLIAAKLQQVRQHHDQHLIRELLTDIEELETEFQGLKNDLRDGADNQQVINAMIENYRLRIMLLERFIDEIDKKETKNAKVNT